MRRLLPAIGVAAIAALPAMAQTKMEADVLRVLNAARANPAAYADNLRRFRPYHGKTFRLPNNPVRYATIEGVAPLDSALAFLSTQLPLPPITRAPGVADAAADHVGDQAKSGATGHYSSDGAGPFERITRRGGGGAVAEVISYGVSSADDVIRQLTVDDGVADRMHRHILFDPGLRFAGVACGKHAVYGIMCVVDFATQTIPTARSVK